MESKIQKWITLRDTRTGRSTRVKNQRMFAGTGTISTRQLRAAMNRLRCWCPPLIAANNKHGVYVEKPNGNCDLFIAPELEYLQ